MTKGNAQGRIKKNTLHHLFRYGFIIPYLIIILSVAFIFFIDTNEKGDVLFTLDNLIMYYNHFGFLTYLNAFVVIVAPLLLVWTLKKQLLNDLNNIHEADLVRIDEIKAVSEKLHEKEMELLKSEALNMDIMLDFTKAAHEHALLENQIIQYKKLKEEMNINMISQHIKNSLNNHFLITQKLSENNIKNIENCQLAKLTECAIDKKIDEINKSVDNLKNILLHYAIIEKQFSDVNLNLSVKDVYRDVFLLERELINNKSLVKEINQALVNQNGLYTEQDVDLETMLVSIELTIEKFENLLNFMEDNH